MEQNADVLSISLVKMYLNLKSHDLPKQRDPHLNKQKKENNAGK